MRFLSDSRAQSVQIGAVLLFGILIVLLSTWQAFVVPNQNEEVEFNHNERVQQQMTELRSTIISMPGADTPQSVTIDVGLRYPSRTIFRNPPPVSGRIQTLDTTDESFNVTIANAEAQNEDFEQLWTRDGASYNTGAIEYRPSYNEYQSAPRTIYSATVLYNAFEREDRQLPLSGQSLVRGNRISLVALNGSLSENGVRSSSLDFEPISTRTREVDVEPEPGEQITLELPTRMSLDRWQELFAEEANVDSSAVTLDQSAFDDEEVGLLRVPLRSDPVGSQDSYRLQLAKVGVGTGTTTPNPSYLTAVDGNGTEIERGESTELTVEVRDRYNKPKSGLRVAASAEGGEFDDGTDTESATSGPDGQATFSYQGLTTGTHNINFTILDGYQPQPGAEHDVTTPENVTMTVEVDPPSGGTGTGGGGGAYNVSWNREQIANSPAVTETADDFEYDATVESELSMPMFTDPSVDGADVEYAVSSQLLGVVDPRAGTTATNGTDSTTLKPRREGVLDVFTTSGSDGDRIKINITDVDLGLLTVDPDVANQASVHNWSFDNVPFRGEVDNITASYPAGTSFDGLDQNDITVYFTREGDSSPTEIDVNSDSYSGTEARFVLDKTFNRDIVGSSWVEIDGLENPDPGTYTATLTFRGQNDTLAVEKEFTIPEKNLTISAANSPIQAGDNNDIAVTLEDESGDPIQGDDVVLNVTNGDGTFTNSSTQSVTVTTNASGQATATYESANSDAGTTVQIDAELANNSSVSDSTTFNVSSASLSNLAVTDVVPTADGQSQAFRFTIANGDLNAGETVTMDLSDPQNSGIVSYENENARVVKGSGQIDNFDASADELVYLADANEPAGTEIEIWVDNLVMDQSSGGPFDISFDRSDAVGTDTTSFDVTRTGRDVKLNSLAISDLVGTTAQDQTIQFTPDGAFGDAERVTIDLSDAQAGVVDYGTAQGITVTQGSAESKALVVNPTNDVAYVTYTSPSDTTTDEPIELTIQDVEPSNDGESYETGVSRGSAGTTNPSFSVREPANFQVTITGTNSPVTEGDDVTVDYEVTNTGDVTDTQDIQFDINGTNEATNSSVTLNGGDTFTGSFTYTTVTGDAPAIETNVSSDDDFATETVTVNEPAFFDVQITGTNSPVTEGETLTVDATITNTGDIQDTQSVNLTDTEFNNTERDTVDVTLTPGESNSSITFEWDTTIGDSGSGNVTVFSEDDSDNENVTVETSQAGSVQVTPNVNSAGSSGKYEFELENTGDIDVTLVGIGINETTESTAVKVGGKNNDDILTETNNGQIVTGEIPVDSSNPDQAERSDFTSNIGLQTGETRTFEFDRFRTSTNGNADMKGDNVVITVWFSDGSASSLTLSP